VGPTGALKCGVAKDGIAASGHPAAIMLMQSPGKFRANVSSKTYEPRNRSGFRYLYHAGRLTSWNS